MNEIGPQKHSRSGVASCVAAVLTWLYLAAAIYLFFYSEAFAGFFNDSIRPRSNQIIDFRGLGIGLVLVLVFFLLIPLAGHLGGLALGLIGVLQKSRKKTFGFVGLAMNALIFAAGFVLYAIGILTGRA